MKGVCQSNLLVLLLVILLTILVVYISLNSFNSEMFTNYQRLNNNNSLHFPGNLLPNHLQKRVDNIISTNKNNDDNDLLSRRHYKQVIETRRPELIQDNPTSPSGLCYVNL